MLTEWLYLLCGSNMDWIEEVIACLLASSICSCWFSGVRRTMFYDLIEIRGRQQ
jgi:hypothetical protein